MNTKTVLIVLFFIGLVVISLLYWRIDTDSQRSKLTAYISMLAIIGTFVLLLSYIEGTNNTARNVNKDLLLTQTQADEKMIVDLEKLFMANSPNLLRLYKQLYPNNAAIQRLPDPQPITSEIIEKEQHALAIILQQVETILYPVLNKTIDPKSPAFEPWIRTLRTWFTSPLLKEYWLANKFYYTRATQQFVDERILNLPNSQS